METTTIPLLIKYSSGQWSGDANVLGLIDYLSHGLGILNYELYRKALREYQKNQDAYDLSAPYLLKYKIIALAKTCTQHNEVTDQMLETLFDYRGVSVSGQIHYPVMPKEILETFKSLLRTLSPYLFLDGKMVTEIANQIIHRLGVNYYMYWDQYVKDPKAWVNHGISMIKSLPFTNDQAVINEMKRAFESYGETIIMVSSPPKRSLRHKLKYLFR